VADPIQLIEQVVNYLEISDHLDAEDVLNVSAKLREALKQLKGE